jgi:hypothetical protein
LKTDEEQTRIYSNVYTIYEKVLALVDLNKSHEPLFDWGNALYRQATYQMTSAKKDLQFTQEKLFELLDTATTKYEAALKAKPDFVQALVNWGTILEWMCLIKRNADTESAFEADVTKYIGTLQVTNFL